LINIREGRVEDAEQIAAVHVESWKTTYNRIISESFLSGLSVEDRLKNWIWTFQNATADQAIFVAEDGAGHIVGFSTGGRNRNKEYKHDGEIYAIYLLQEYQRQGVGTRLFRAVADALRNHGCSSMMLWVLKDNPAVGFYKRQGGQVIGQKDVTIGGESLLELAIGWDSFQDQE